MCIRDRYWKASQPPKIDVNQTLPGQQMPGAGPGMPPGPGMKPGMPGMPPGAPGMPGKPGAPAMPPAPPARP